MKIGILTYCNAINFGANLQAFSTYNYFINRGYTPIFLNYKAKDYIDSYSSFPSMQILEHQKFLESMNVSKVFSDSRSLAKLLRDEGIKNVVIGSDAVAQHHPFLSQIVFPSKRHIISRSKPTSDRMFPNPFWGEFLNFSNEINVCLMSVSSQQSQYKLFSRDTRSQMYDLISRFSYISVRDSWTKKMYENISGGRLSPVKTPDPVFAFNYNCKQYIPSRDEILKKFHLPENYILLGIRNGKSVSPQWSKDFESLVEKNGFKCIGLPFPYGYNSLNCVSTKINIPLSPIDWYSIIKYSSGFVGHNMHTIVSSLHNSVPCYSLDQYGQRIFMQFCKDRSSKIFDILHSFGFEDYRAVSGTVFNLIPSANDVVEKLLTFDRIKCSRIADSYLEDYKNMMCNIENTFVC